VVLSVRVEGVVVLKMMAFCREGKFDIVPGFSFFMVEKSRS
jgi:hypothetical protein